jgi:hypothetical protein
MAHDIRALEEQHSRDSEKKSCSAEFEGVKVVQRSESVTVERDQ